MGERGAERLTGLALLVYGGLFVYLAARHVAYPGFTEAMEGDALQHVERAARRLALYPAPSGEFIALPYMPLYYVLSAPLYAVFGDSFAGPRLLSAFCALASGGLVGWMAWRESGSRATAWLAAALYFASYRIMDAALLMALPDALLLFWVLLGSCFLLYGRTRGHDLAWLLCFALAFWTKQHGAFFFGFAVLYALVFRKNALPRWAILLGLVLGGPVAYVAVGPYLGEAFFFHTLVVPARWEHRLWFGVRRTVFVLACFVPLALVLSLCALPRPLRLWQRLVDRRIGAFGWLVATALVSTTFTMSAAGSANNHYVPFLALLCVSATLGAHALARDGAPRWLGALLGLTALGSVAVTGVALRAFSGHTISLLAALATGAAFLVYAGSRAFHRPLAGGTVAAVLVAGQLMVSFYLPARYLPDPAYRESLARLRAELAGLGGPVVWLDYGNAPEALTGRKLERVPSWVGRLDIYRQQVPVETIARDLAPFRDRLSKNPGLWILADGRLEGWPELEGIAFELVRDFGRAFAPVARITETWYMGRTYPRFLYRVAGAASGDVRPAGDGAGSGDARPGR